MQTQKEDKRKKRIFGYTVAAVLVILILLLLQIRYNHFKTEQLNTTGSTGQNAINEKKITDVRPDTMVKTGTSIAADTPGLSFKSVKRMTIKNIAPMFPDTFKQNTSTALPTSDTVSAALPGADTTSVTNPCSGDTIKPWVYPDPSGGLHHEKIAVQFGSNKPCIIDWRFEKNSDWIRYDGTPVNIDRSCTIVFTATDSCGNRMETRRETYDIDIRSAGSENCPEDMVNVKVGTVDFCIDKYEWPNRKGGSPVSYISVYNAMDSCFAARKRLCTSEEWQIACAGPYSWRYPYGQVYEKNACATHDPAAPYSGARPECRSYFGAYDMSGGMLEWTSTRSLQNRNFYYVMGGFWESGPQSGCSDSRYSYFPQNRHNPVGFRCCKDIGSGGGDAPKTEKERAR